MISTRVTSRSCIRVSSASPTSHPAPRSYYQLADRAPRFVASRYGLRRDPWRVSSGRSGQLGLAHFAVPPPLLRTNRWHLHQSLGADGRHAYLVRENGPGAGGRYPRRKQPESASSSRTRPTGTGGSASRRGPRTTTRSIAAHSAAKRASPASRESLPRTKRSPSRWVPCLTDRSSISDPPTRWSSRFVTDCSRLAAALREHKIAPPGVDDPNVYRTPRCGPHHSRTQAPTLAASPSGRRRSARGRPVERVTLVVSTSRRRALRCIANGAGVAGLDRHVVPSWRSAPQIPRGAVSAGDYQTAGQRSPAPRLPQAVTPRGHRRAVA